MVSEATGPYFKQVVADDVKNSGSPFTLQYDETTNAQINKQLDIKIRYWSSAQSQVVVHHLQTYLMGHATGRQLAEKIISSIQDNGIAFGQLQMLESDGPNVNKTVWNIVNDALVNLPNRNYGLTDIGTRNLHICHNAFAKGLEMFGSSISEFVIDLHLWFKMSAARREDYELVQEEMGLAKHKFLKHVECRWLSLHPALLRILEQLKGLKKYFLTVLPKKQSSSTSNARYIRIRRQLESKDLVAQIHFLVSVADIFNPFLKFFQTEEPLVHLLCDQLATLLAVLLGRFIRKDLLANKSTRKLSKICLEDVGNHLAYTELERKEQTRQEIKKLSEEKQKKFVLGAKSFLIAATKHLINKLPFDNLILRSSIVLKPDVRSEDWAPKAIRILAKELKVSVDLDNLADEWRIYQLENIPEDWHTQTEEPRKPIRVDHFWRKVDQLKDSSGQRKFSSIMKVVKTALVLGHGNAEVERGFSESGKSVTDDRVRLSEASINGIRATSDGLKAFKGPGSVPIKKQLLQLGRSAHAIMLCVWRKSGKRRKTLKSSLLYRENKHYKWKHRNDNLVEKRKIYSAKRKS